MAKTSKSYPIPDAKQPAAAAAASGEKPKMATKVTQVAGKGDAKKAAPKRAGKKVGERLKVWMA